MVINFISPVAAAANVAPTTAAPAMAADTHFFHFPLQKREVCLYCFVCGF